MSIKKISIKYGMNKDFKIPKKIFTNEQLRKQHNRFFGYIDSSPLDAKIQKAGDIFDYIFDNEVNENNAKIAIYFINRLMGDGNLTTDKIELANVFYSTLLKYIKPADVIKEKISPRLYKSIINNSIKNYYEHPVGKEIDYRHIAGRMLNLKNLSDSIPKTIKDFNAKFSLIRWTDERQADLVGVLERIIQFYDSSQESFKQSNGFLRRTSEQNITTYESHYENLYNNITELLELTLQRICFLINEPIKYKDLIKDKLEIAYYYYDKVPYNSKCMPKLIKSFTLLREQEKKLECIIKNNR